MAIHRIRRPPCPAPSQGTQTLYEVTLSAVPSAAWRAAVFRPPPGLTSARRTPELCRLGLDGDRVTFCATPAQLHQWLRWIDRWIAYANSVVEK